MSAHPELAAEQAYIDRAYERLARLQAATQEWRDGALRWEGGTPQAVDEREVFVRKTSERLHQLDIGDASLVFGRVDTGDPERFYIGRLAVSDERQEQLVIDWRAPVAEPFYRATGRHPLGLTLRRHFLCEGRRLQVIEDERFGDAESGDGELGLAGPGALMAALEQARTGRMRDIVATIQREQDEIIRADLPGVLAVQGGPGTGKTAVALHRAAYLLFTHRRRLGRHGMLVVGPNRVFLRYIDHVLPALGESGVDLRTVNGLVEGVKVGGLDTPGAARLKGDARMAEVIAKAVADRQRWLRRNMRIPFGAHQLVLSVDLSRGVWRAARRARGSHNRRRRQVESWMGQRLFNEYEQVRRREHLPSAVTGEKDFTRLVRGEPAFVEALERMWPSLTPQELINDLFGSPALVASASRGILTAAEQRLLARPRSADPDAVAWTSADLPLLDEAFTHLGHERRGRRRKEEDDIDEIDGYGHVVVDEVQDLSPMQLRMIRRRSLTGSMTVVGDIAQATGALAPTRWDDVLVHLPARDEVRRAELSVSYRTPAEIMDVAGRVLRVAAPELEPPMTVRGSGTAPRFLFSTDLAADVAAAAGDELAKGDGTVAVVCPPRMGGRLATALRAAGVSFGEARREGIDEVLTIVPVTLAKGLEFDSVVLAEPARIVRESPQGLRALYVALTRATKRLTIVHSEPLPEALADAGIDRLAVAPT